MPQWPVRASLGGCVAEECENPAMGAEASGASAAETQAATKPVDEEHAAMLEVHAPHQAPHTWKDFFIHIAIITIGLLIAIGLEQTVEYVHHLNQLQVARRELAAEIDDNRRIAKRNTELLRNNQAELDNDMKLLRASQSQHASSGARLDYSWNFSLPPDGAWQTVKQNGTLDLMPHDELRSYVYVYGVIYKFIDALIAHNQQMEVAAAITRRAPNGSLSPRDIEELISATSDAQAKSAFLARTLEFEMNGLSRLK